MLRIAVIGAGPAGITAAYELKKRGYQNIVIFGDPKEAQCKTIKIEDVIADVGTCYTHPGYWNTVYRLVKYAGFHIKKVGLPDILNSKNEPIPPTVKDFFGSVMISIIFILVTLKYRIFRRTCLSKNYSFSAAKFLELMHLKGVKDSFIFSAGSVAQGYGFLGKVTAYHLFQWLSPAIFITPFVNKIHRGTGIIQEGYGELYSKLLSEYTHKNEIVKSVQPQISASSSTQVVQVVTQKGEEYEFDQVVIACPLDQVESPASSLINIHTKMDTKLASFLWTSRKAPFFKDRVYYKDLLLKEVRNRFLSFRTYGKTASGLHVYWGVAYPADGISEEALKQELIHQVNDQIKLDIDKVHFYKVFNYDLRFTKDAIMQGIHLQLEKLQGVNHIWYSGGMLSHWDVDAIHEFNERLATMMWFSESKPSFWGMVKYYLKLFFYRLEGI
jgi:hypothetical protein